VDRYNAPGHVTSFDAWLAALEARHLANLTRSELTRALRALSSLYVERREKLATGAALDSAGKRAAFALFYGPLHFFTIDAVVRALGANRSGIDAIVDLGCGTGVGGAAWALACDRTPQIAGIDRNAWAVAEANWTYQQLGLRGRARTGDALRGLPIARPTDHQIPRSAHPQILLAYTVNELSEAARAGLLDKLVDTTRTGTGLLIVEPIAKRDKTWWPEWTARLGAEGARADEWRFPASLPASLRQIARSAGLDPRELTARSISTI
jgi:methyltransferase family protein